MKKRNNLHQFLNQAANTDIDDVLHSHAYRKVGKKAGPTVPAAKRQLSLNKKAVAGYRDSLVGSAAQYKKKIPDLPTEKSTPVMKESEGVIGNRPTSAIHDRGKKDTQSLERRHHFIEPPKRNFNRFG